MVNFFVFLEKFLCVGHDLITFLFDFVTLENLWELIRQILGVVYAAVTYFLVAGCFFAHCYHHENDFFKVESLRSTFFSSEKSANNVFNVSQKTCTIVRVSVIHLIIVVLIYWVNHLNDYFLRWCRIVWKFAWYIMLFLSLLYGKYL